MWWTDEESMHGLAWSEQVRMNARALCSARSKQKPRRGTSIRIASQLGQGQTEMHCYFFIFLSNMFGCWSKVKPLAFYFASISSGFSPEFSLKYKICQRTAATQRTHNAHAHDTSGI